MLTLTCQLTYRDACGRLGPGFVCVAIVGLMPALLKCGPLLVEQIRRDCQPYLDPRTTGGVACHPCGWSIRTVMLARSGSEAYVAPVGVYLVAAAEGSCRHSRPLASTIGCGPMNRPGYPVWARHPMCSGRRGCLAQGLGVGVRAAAARWRFCAVSPHRWR